MEELNKLQESAEHKALLAVIRIECVEWTRYSKQVEKYLQSFEDGIHDDDKPARVAMLAGQICALLWFMNRCLEEAHKARQALYSACSPAAPERLEAQTLLRECKALRDALEPRLLRLSLHHRTSIADEQQGMNG